MIGLLKVALPWSHVSAILVCSRGHKILRGSRARVGGQEGRRGCLVLQPSLELLQGLDAAVVGRSGLVRVPLLCV